MRSRRRIRGCVLIGLVWLTQLGAALAQEDVPLQEDTKGFGRGTIDVFVARNLAAGKASNRLLTEKSPYLLQHAFNPVNWYAWGDEAFEAARKQDKPIFLSVGYSTCYWCHVMEREVFEDETIAALMNEYVISIKVDREERPDVDGVYMTALQAMTGSGGWPMSLFLTPDLKPFFAATYIPPATQAGQLGFTDILTRIHATWETDRGQITQLSQQLGDYLKAIADPKVNPKAADELALDQGYQALAKIYDPQDAGFGGAPKFPKPVTLNFLFRYYSRTGEKHALEMSLETLRRMAAGGMYDHIGGGFHRYSTDKRWHVPHFEKMLYDQAQLAVSYLEAFQISRDPYYADVAREILDYVQHNMTHASGGFYSAEDAESAVDRATPDDKKEGAFYTWSRSEIEDLLPAEDALVFSYHYGIESDGNVDAARHPELSGENILFAAHTTAETAKWSTLSTTAVTTILAASREQLFSAREERPRPHLDDKVLVSWNGLMISAFAKAHQILGDEKYLRSAEQASQFVLDNLYNGKNKQLLRRYRDGEARFEANLEDYAFFIQGLLDLYEASFNIEWLKTAIVLTEQQIIIFHDADQGGFYDISGNDKSIIIRTKESYDGAEPAGNSIAILNLLRLSQMTDNQGWRAMALKSLAYFGEQMLSSPQSMVQFLVALDFSLTKPKQIIIAGVASAPSTSAMLAEIHSRFIPNKIMLLADGMEGQQLLRSYIPFIQSVLMFDEMATAYICEDYACKLPTSDLAVVARLLQN